MIRNMVVIGLTGSLGSGKSTVARMLGARGAVVIDLDVVARQAMEPGGVAHEAVVERFGPGVLAPDGRVDRRALADVVFADPAALADLNAIVHPAAGEEVSRLLDGLPPDCVAVLEVPLLVEAGWTGRADAVLVVDTPEDVAVARVVDHRGLSEDEARRRLAAQADRATRLFHADFVIDNSGPLDLLTPQVDAAWQWIESVSRRKHGVN